MQSHKAVITSHTLEPLGKPVLTIEFPAGITIGTGQFVLANLPGNSDPLRTRLFPIEFAVNGFTSDFLPGPAWLPGLTMEILGPFGKPFLPPDTARRWFLLSLGDHPGRLLPLLQLGRTQSASMAFWSKEPRPFLPSDVEHPAELVEAIDWADFIAIELPGLDWPGEFISLRSQLLQRKDATIQILVDVPTPCGLGACQACAIPERKGWSLGCQSGLVLSLEQTNG